MDPDRWALATDLRLDAMLDPTVATAEQHERLEISPASGVSGPHFNGFTTRNVWDFRGFAASVEAVRMPTERVGAMLVVRSDPQNWYAIVCDKGGLCLGACVNGTKTSTSVPYDAKLHRLWRLRHDAAKNLVFWETSDDGTKWSVQRVESADVFLRSVRIDLLAGTYEAAYEPDTAVFDTFRLARQK